MHRKIGLASSVFLMITSMLIVPSVAVTWSEHVERLTTYRDFDGLPSITQTSDGRIWLVWARNIRGNYSLFYMTSSDTGASWSTEASLTTDLGINTAPAILQTVDGMIWLVWSSNRTGIYDLYCKTSSDEGLSWSDETRLTTDPSYDLSPSITQTVDGMIWLVWSSGRTGDYDLYYKTSSNGGLSWSTETRLTADPHLDKLPSIAQTSDGRIWVFWSSDRQGDPDIFYKVYDGLSWSSDTPMGTAPTLDKDPSILQTRDGTIWVFWSSRSPKDAATATDDLYYTCSYDNGVSWSGDTQLTTDANDDLWSSAMQTSDFKILVVWTSNRGDLPDGNWDIYCRVSLVGDINEDGIVNIFDLSVVGQCYATSVGDPGWNPDADINKDGIVDISDLSILGKNYGAT